MRDTGYYYEMRELALEVRARNGIEGERAFRFFERRRRTFYDLLHQL